VAGGPEFPADGLTLRGRAANSGVLWLVGLLGAVVAVSDIAVGLQWLWAGRPFSALFGAAGVVLTICTVLLAAVLALTVVEVRRQRYAMSTAGLDLPWRTRGPDLRLAWTEIQMITRWYDDAPGGRTMGVAVFVAEPQRLLAEAGRSALANQEARGTPVVVDLTDVPGGTVWFFAAARWYAGLVGRDDLLLV
jgi:hypothetical protein